MELDTAKKNWSDRVRKLRAKLNTLSFRIIALLLTFAIGFGLGLWQPWEKDAVRALPADDPEPKVIVVPDDDKTITISTVQEILSPASGLITSEYHYTSADTSESYKTLFKKWKLPFTTSKTVFTYKGCIKLGIDFSKVGYELDNESKTITITLPEHGILANEINFDSFRFPFQSNSIFNVQTMEDYTSLIETLKEQNAEAVLADEEYMSSAVENTKMILQGFLTAADATKDYSVVFK